MKELKGRRGRAENGVQKTEHQDGDKLTQSKKGITGERVKKKQRTGGWRGRVFWVGSTEKQGECSHS